MISNGIVGLILKKKNGRKERKPRGSRMAIENPAKRMSLLAFYSSATDIFYRCSNDVVARNGLFCFIPPLIWLMLFHCNFIQLCIYQAIENSVRQFHSTFTNSICICFESFSVIAIAINFISRQILNGCSTLLMIQSTELSWFSFYFPFHGICLQKL